MHQSDVIPRIVLAAQALTRIAAQETRSEAPAAQWRVLSLLERHDGLRIGALVAAARTTQPGMTRMIGDLDRAGFVSRSADPHDSRGTVVRITDAGRAAMNAWRRDFRAVLEPRFADLSQDDWATLARAAEILTAHSAEDNKTGDRE